MKHLRILITAATVAVFSSCQRDDIPDSGRQPGEEPIRFEIGIEQMDSRLNNNDLQLQKTFFEDGDRISLYVVRRPIYQSEPALPTADADYRLENLRMEYMDGEWRFLEDNIKLYREPGYRYDYYAHYPDGTGKFPQVDPNAMTYSATSGKYINSADLMCALNTTTTDGTKVVTLNFKHMLSMFEVRQPGLGDKASIRLVSPKIIASGKMNIPEGTFATDDPDEEGSGAQVVNNAEFKLASNGRYRLWLPEQTLPVGDDTYIEICANKDNKNDLNTFTYPLVNSSGVVEFNKGHSRYLEFMPEFNEELAHTPNTIFFGSRLGQRKRTPIAKAYYMWLNDPVLKATNPDLYGDLSIKMLWTDKPDFDKYFFVDLINTDKGAEALLQMQWQGGDGAVPLPAEYEGNAVYGLFIGDTLRWSWHLWGSTILNPTDDKNTVQYGEDGPVFMACNLGALPGTAGSGAGRGLLYQYGRKDPFPGAAYDGWDFTEYQTTYDKEGNIVNKEVVVEPDPEDPNPADPEEFLFEYGILLDGTEKYPLQPDVDGATLNPMVFSTQWNPTTPDLWNTGVDGKKSPYDPCPVGWRVGVDDSQSVWYKDGSTNLTDYTDAVWNNGIVFDKVGYKLGYYPQTNYRQADGTFAIGGNNDRIFMWHGGAAGNAFTVTAQGQVNTNATETKAFGATVRCVKDDTDKEIWSASNTDYWVWKSIFSTGQL